MRSAEGKAATRDPALTWELPQSIDAGLSEQVVGVREAFAEEAGGHLDALAAQLLASKGIKNVALWSRLIARLAQESVSLISPIALRAADVADPRSGIRVEIVPAPTSLPNESEVIDGAAFRGNVVHKRMRTFISQPRVMALSGALEYEKPDDKLSSFDALMDSEKQHLAHLVQKITAMQPDVVLLEGSVARHAQELLLASGISVIAHVEVEELAQAARCTGANLQSIASLSLSEDCIGTCQDFEVVISPSADNGEVPATPTAATNPMVVFRACGRGMGSSIVLRGSSEAEHILLHEIVRTIVEAAYWNRLEAAILADQLLAVASQLHLQPTELAAIARSAARHSIGRTADKRGERAILSASPHVSIFGYDENDCNASDSGRRGLHSAASYTDLQQLWTTISCRNPAKGVVCETPHVHSMPFYAQGDLSLPSFLAAAAPKQLKCPHPRCGEGAALHLRSFLHGDSQLTLSSVHLTPGQELPPGVWLWLRRLGSGNGGSRGSNSNTVTAPAEVVQRVALSNDALCVSFSHFLSLLLDARDLQVVDTEFRHDFVRYFGQGRTVICLHHTRVEPFNVSLPPAILRYSPNKEALWLQDQVKTLEEEAVVVFDCLEDALRLAAGEAWLAELADVRSAFLGCTRNISNLMSASSSVTPTIVMAINRLRRVIHLGVQTINALSGKSTCGTAVAAMSGPAPPSDVSQPSTKPGSTTSSTGHSRHASDASDLNLHFSRLYPAPKLMDVEAAAGVDATAVVSERDAIPTGLVARHISRFEAPQLLQTDNFLPTSESPEHDAAAPNSLGVPAARRPSTTIDLRPGSGVTTVYPSGGLLQLSESFGIAVLEQKMMQFHSEALEQLSCSLGLQAPSGVPASNEKLSSLFKGRFLLPRDVEQPLVTIFDEEITSVVAYFLSTKQYQDYLADATNSCAASLDNDVSSLLDGCSSTPSPSSHERILQASLQLDCQMIVEDETAPLPVRYHVTTYYAPQFAALRKLCIDGGEDAFLASMSRCKPWFPQGGKSGVYFAKTNDNMFVIKQLSRPEFRSLLDFAPEYFKHVQESLQDTCLSKILGLYQVSIEYLGGEPAPFGGKEGTMDVIVMQNCFAGRNIAATYDLKGSIGQRYNVEGNLQPGVVLHDDTMIQQSPTLISPSGLQRLQSSLRHDCAFLSSMGVMDYSLLVGVDKVNSTLVVGLVDFLRKFTLDKQLESIVKTVGAAGKEPTVISPKAYAERFITAIKSYFTVVPSLDKPPIDDEAGKH